MNGLSKEDSLRLKGVAVLFLLFHHMFYTTKQFEGYVVDFYPLNEGLVIDISAMLKICVCIFAFISGYGLFASVNNTKNQSNTNKWITIRYIKLIGPFLFVYILSFVVTAIINGFPIHKYFDGSRFAGLAYLLIDAFGLAGLFGTPSLLGSWWYMSAAIVFIAIVPVVYWAQDKLGWIATFILVIALPRLFGINFPGSNCPYTFIPILMLGMLSNKYKLFQYIDSALSKRFQVNSNSVPYIIISITALCLSFIIMFVAFRSIDYRDMYELIYGFLPFICIITLRYFARIWSISRFTMFFGKHSMTIFLIHGFIRSVYLTEFVYSFGNWFVDFIALTLASTIVAVCVDWIRSTICLDAIISKLVCYVNGLPDIKRF